MAQARSQAEKLQTDNPQAQAKELLQRARKALAENDLEGAEGLVRLAEATGAQFGPFHIGDTPKRLRKAIKKRRQAPAKSPKLPSQLFSPKLFGKKDATPAADPFAGRDAAPVPSLNEIQMPGGRIGEPAAMPAIDPNNVSHLPQVEAITKRQRTNPPTGTYPNTGMNPFSVNPGSPLPRGIHGTPPLQPGLNTMTGPTHPMW